MPWRSAEQLLAEADPFWDPKEAVVPAGATHVLRFPPGPPLRANVLRTHRNTAAEYRCQAPDPDCQCFECWKSRRPPKKTREKAHDVRLRKLADRLSKRSPFRAETAG